MASLRRCDVEGRFAAVDVYYPVAGGARAAMVLASDLAFSTIVAERIVSLEHVAEYRPGRFFERELPAIGAVLAGQVGLELVLVDGYVHLDPGGRPGLGAHVHSALGLPVIGVAKTRFRAATHAIEVVRGAATRPLYVTSVGVTPDRAAAIVRGMAGAYRIPDALRQVDALSRSPAERLGDERWAICGQWPHHRHISWGHRRGLGVCQPWGT